MLSNTKKQYYKTFNKNLEFYFQEATVNTNDESGKEGRSFEQEKDY